MKGVFSFFGQGGSDGLSLAVHYYSVQRFPDVSRAWSLFQEGLSIGGRATYPVSWGREREALLMPAHS